MSDVKFACPVCGQHITTDRSTTGGQMECPTCFRRLLVPAAGTGTDSKLVLTASLAPPQRATDATSSAIGKRQGPSWRVVKWTLAGALFTTFLASLLLFRGDLSRAVTGKLNQWKQAIYGKNDRNQERVPNPKPGSGWSLDATKILVPEGPVTGRVRGKPFQYARATLNGGHLSLKHGAAWPPPLSLTIQFYAERAEELAGKTIEVAADRTPPVPVVVIRWIDEQGRPDEQMVSAGYVLLAQFGELEGGRLPGQLYLALPDESRSYAAGLFVAAVSTNRPAGTNESTAVTGTLRE
jgi:hypothetical protein